jgi:hypothetical protein
MAEDDIPVSDAMIEAGWKWVNRDLEDGKTAALIELYRAMERVRRAEADELLAHARSVCSRLQLGS